MDDTHTRFFLYLANVSQVSIQRVVVSLLKHLTTRSLATDAAFVSFVYYGENFHAFNR